MNIFAIKHFADIHAFQFPFFLGGAANKTSIPFETTNTHRRIFKATESDGRDRVLGPLPLCI